MQKMKQFTKLKLSRYLVMFRSVCISISCAASLIFVLSLGFSTIAVAKKSEDIPVDSRIKLLTYSANDVYKIPTKYGYQTSIVFSASEIIKTVSVGDRSMWQIVPSGNRIFLRPMDDNLATNMTVITNLREYNFDIESVAADKSGNLYVVQFRYPGRNVSSEQFYDDSTSQSAQIQAIKEVYDDNQPPLPVKLNIPDKVVMKDAEEKEAAIKEAAAKESAEKESAEKEVAKKENDRAEREETAPLETAPVTKTVQIPTLDTQRVKGINRNYSYSGADDIAPAEVYDDGKYTYVLYKNMPSPTPLPMLSGSGGGQSVATHSVNGNKMLIRTVVRRFTLSAPSGEITVYNEQF